MSDTYRAAKAPLAVGQPRTKAWRYLIEPSGDDDPTWRDRVKAYWTMFERLYGVVLHRDAVVVRVDRNSGTVTTWAAIKTILPGERRKNYTPPGGMASLYGRS